MLPPRLLRLAGAATGVAGVLGVTAPSAAAAAGAARGGAGVLGSTAAPAAALLRRRLAGAATAVAAPASSPPGFAPTGAPAAAAPGWVVSLRWLLWLPLPLRWLLKSAGRRAASICAAVSPLPCRA